MSSTVSAALIVVALLVALLGAIKAMRLSLQNFILALASIVLGLLLGALISIPLGNLPAPYGTVLPLGISLALTIVMLFVVFSQRSNILHLVPLLKIGPDTSALSTAPSNDEILVDTSVIIDGRIADIAKAGFIRGKLLVPRFVLAELQNIADSDDAMRRGRGRRGLEMLHSVRENTGLESEVIEDDLPDIKEVDAKLVALAKIRGCDVLTTDYNLNRVAQIEGVRVLNINELANAIRPVVIPGEQMMVKIVQAGKERGQGVGYLADGTMIVVDQGDKLIGQEIPTEVTRVFQTVAGKMIFAAPLKMPASSRQPTKTEPPKTSHKPAQPVQSPSADNKRPKPNRHRFASQKQIEDRLVEHTNSATPPPDK